ncbi:MAG: hypothetical protein QW703_01470 [Candidatus Aenigmatarchaeota archaeon]
MRGRITKDELIADAIFITIPAILTLVGLFVFDVHRSFYPGHEPFTEFVFDSPWPYLFGGLLGGILGFWLIKLFLYGLHKEEEAEEEFKKKSKG